MRDLACLALILIVVPIVARAESGAAVTAPRRTEAPPVVDGVPAATSGSPRLEAPPDRAQSRPAPERSPALERGAEPAWPAAAPSQPAPADDGTSQ